VKSVARRVAGSSWVVWALVLVALVLRVGFVLSVGDEKRWPDEGEYHVIAVSLLEGHGYSSYWSYTEKELSPTAFRVPLLPLTLAGLYAIFGPHLLAARLFQSLLGALLVLLAFRMARALELPRGAGVLAALITAVYPYYIFAAGAVYPITLAAVLVATAVLLLLKGRLCPDFRFEAAAGFVLGLATLDFGHVLPAVPLVALWIWKTKQAARRARAFAAAAVVACCMLVLVPWVARNWVTMHRPILSTAFARNLCLGNQPAATWNSGSRSGVVPPDLAGRLSTLDESDGYVLYMKTAIEMIRARPVRFLRVSVGRAFYLWRLFPEPVTRSLSLKEKIVGAGSYGPVLLLGVIWFAIDKRRRRLYWLLAIFPLAATALAAVTVSVDRYRLPYDIDLIVLAAGAVASWLGARSRRSNP
jgi:4-amino-4-deoxy-L-arabinose transferase-like glycosyltransferase